MNLHRLSGICAGLLLAAAAFGDARVTLSADPELPARNLLAGPAYNADFSAGLKIWKIKNGKEAFSIIDTDGNPALRIAGCNVAMHQDLPPRLFRPGRTYLASCRFRPESRFPFKPYCGGPGFSVSFFSKDWSKSAPMAARFSRGCKEPGEGWIKLVGTPFTVPDWAKSCQMSVDIFYYEKENACIGLIDDLTVTEAFTRLSVAVEASAAIRQVRIYNDADDLVYDSGVLRGEANQFRHALEVDTAHSYRAIVLCADGKVFKTVYPDRSPIRGGSAAATGGISL